MDYLFVIAVLVSFVAGVVLTIVFNRSVEEKALSYARSRANTASLEKKQEKKARFQEALAEAVLIMKSSEIPPEERNKKLVTLALKYPDVAAELAQEFGFDGLKNFL